MSMSLSLVNVTVEMIPRFSFGKIPSKPNAPAQLGKLDFVQSKFVFESFSDGSRSMDLVSHGVLLHDIRGTGIFNLIYLYLLLAEVPSVAWVLNGLSVDAVYPIVLLYPPETPVPWLSVHNLVLGSLLCLLAC